MDAKQQGKLEKAKDKLRDFLVRNTISRRGPHHETGVFFVSVEKSVGAYPFRAAVAYKNGAIVLMMDYRFVNECTDDQLDFVLLHELGHIARLSFMRTADMCSFYNVPPNHIAPFADPPINGKLENHPGYSSILNSEGGMLTYNVLRGQGLKGIEDDMTYEELVMKFMDQGGDNIPKVSVYFIDSEGNVTDSNGETVDDPGDIKDGVAMAMPDPKDIPAIKESIKKQVENAKKSVGSGSSYFLDEIDALMNEDTEHGFRLFEKYLIGIRSNNKPADRSFSRPKRRALPLNLIMPDTQYRNDAFNCLFMVDESGSMYDHYIEYAAGLLQKILTRKNLDTIHIAQWDTDLHPPIATITASSPQFKYVRKGHGGTDFTKSFSHEEIEPLLKEVDLVVFITDGGVYGLPEIEPKCPVIWLFTENAPSVEKDLLARGNKVIDVSFISKR